MTVRERMEVIKVLKYRPEKAPYCYYVQTRDGRQWMSQWPDKVIDFTKDS